jgi:hypothetical protein
MGISDVLNITDEYGDIYPIRKLKGVFFSIYFSENTFNANKVNLKIFLEKLLLDNDNSNLEIFYEIMSSHESEPVKTLAISLSLHHIEIIDREKQIKLFRLWINYPRVELIPIFRKIKTIFRDSDKEEEQAMFLVGCLFGIEPNYRFTDNELHLIERFVSNKPILYSPIQRAVNIQHKKLRTSSLFQEASIINQEGDVFFQSAENLLFSREMIIWTNPERLWDRLLLSPLVTIIHFFPRIFAFKNWTPDPNTSTIFYMIKEIFKNSGWYAHENLLLETIECNPNEWDKWDFKLNLSRFIIMFPNIISPILDLLTSLEFDLISDNTEYYFLSGYIKELNNEDRDRVRFFSLRFISSNKLNFELTNDLLFIKDNAETVFSINIQKILSLILPPNLLTEQQIHSLQNFIQPYNEGGFFNEYILMKRNHMRYGVFFKKIADFWGSQHFEFKIERNNLEQIHEFKNAHISKISDRKTKKLQSVLNIDFGDTYTRISVYHEATNSFISGDSFVREEYVTTINQDRSGKICSDGIQLSSCLFFDPRKGPRIFMPISEISEQIHIVYDMKSRLLSGTWCEKINVAGEFLNYKECITLYFKRIAEIINLDEYPIKKIQFSIPIEAKNDYQHFLTSIFSDIFNVPKEQIQNIDEQMAGFYGILDYVQNDDEFRNQLIKFPIQKLDFPEENEEYLLLNIGSNWIRSNVIHTKGMLDRILTSNQTQILDIGSKSLEKKAYWKLDKDIIGDHKDMKRKVLILQDQKHRIESGQKYPSDLIELERLNEKFNSIINNKIKRKIQQIFNYYSSELKSTTNKIKKVFIIGQGLKFRPFLEIFLQIHNKINSEIPIIPLIKYDFLTTIGLVRFFQNGSLKNQLIEMIGILSTSNIQNQGNISHNHHILQFTHILNKNYQIPMKNPIKIVLKPHYPSLQIDNVNFRLYSVHKQFSYLVYNKNEEKAIIELSEIKIQLKNKHLIEPINTDYVSIPLVNGESTIFLYINNKKQILLGFLNKKKQFQINRIGNAK